MKWCGSILLPHHCIVPTWSCSKVVYKPVWHIPLLSVQWINSWWWADELSETCRISWQNKFVKLVHLVGFITKPLCRFFTSVRPSVRPHAATRLEMDGLPWDFVLGNWIKIANRNSVVGIATVLRVGWSGVPVPVEARDFSVIQNVQTGSGASYSKDTGVLSRGVKRLGF
jgi:hypothetical protein